MKLADRVKRNMRYYMAVQRRTQGAVARRLGVNQQSVSHWMNGSRAPTLKHVEQMATIFGIDPALLFAEKLPVRGVPRGKGQ